MSGSMILSQSNMRNARGLVIVPSIFEISGRINPGQNSILEIHFRSVEEAGNGSFQPERVISCVEDYLARTAIAFVILSSGQRAFSVPIRRSLI